MCARRALFLAVGLVLAACGTRGDLYKGNLSPLPAVTTQSSWILVVPQTRRAVIVRPGEETTTALVISEGARRAAAVPGGVQVAVLGGSVEAPVLDVVDPDAGEVHTLSLPGAFDLITFSDDGRWAVLTYSASGGSRLAARNLNEIALVDLQTRRVSRLQLDTESLAPRQVVFGPPEPDRQLVTVALDRGVAVFDAFLPDVPARRISIRPQGSLTDSTVQETLFAPDGAFLYLRATGLDDVISVELSRGPEGIGASINFLAGGRGLQDIALTTDEAITGVVAVFSESREGWLLDPRGITDNNRTIPLPEPLTQIQPLRDGTVLFHSPSSRSVVAWNVIDGKSGAAVLDATSQSPVFAEALDLAVFPHAFAPSGGTAALSVVTVEDDVNRLRTRIRSIVLASPLTSSVFGDEGRRLYFTLKDARELVSLELSTLQLHQTALEAPVDALVFIPEGDWVGGIHLADRLGDVTFVPASLPDAAQAIRYRAVALTGALDLPEDP